MAASTFQPDQSLVCVMAGSQLNKNLCDIRKIVFIEMVPSIFFQGRTL